MLPARERSDFVAYLGRNPQFCDGTKSLEPGATLGQANFRTVSDYFQDQKKRGAHLTAATVLAGSDKPLWIFFNPAEIVTDPAKVDSHFYPAMDFHEDYMDIQKWVTAIRLEYTAEASAKY